MRKLLKRQEGECKSLKKVVRAAEVIAKKAEEGCVAKASKARVALDERALEIEALEAWLQESRAQATATEEHAWGTKLARVLTEESHVTHQSYWRAMSEEVSSLRKKVARLEGQAQEAEAQAQEVEAQVWEAKAHTQEVVARAQDLVS